MQLITLDFFAEHLGPQLPTINLLDVGAAGGIDASWRVFGARLNALGVDPLVAEVKRLNAEEASENIKYYAAFVEWRHWDSLYPAGERRGPSNESFARTSAAAAQDLNTQTYIQETYNRGESVVYSDERVEIDDLVNQMPERRVDFIKTDTDGFDFPALLSGEKLLSGNQVLALKVEANLHGPDHAYANNFANIDRHLRRKGFTLLDLKTYNYSRARCPTWFTYAIPAQTRTGSVQWADAYYFRDFANPAFEELRYRAAYNSVFVPREQELIRNMLDGMERWLAAVRSCVA